MTLLAAALLGIVQGLTEFLPVSSSAHLILAREFFGWNTEGAFGIAFDVACHVGTLLAVVAFFRADIARMVVAAPRALTGHQDPDARRVRLIAVGTIPIVIVGGLWADAVDAVRTPTIAATALLVGALLLLAIERMGRGGRDEQSLTMAGAFAIGVAQSVALIPGVSRSGITIATGMFAGLRREAAARFTFLMSVPAILAAAAKEALELRHVGLAPGDATLFLVGLATSAIVGYLTVKYFIKFLASHSLDVFAWYRIALAVVTFIWIARQ